jgi:hypothetical protein
MAEKGARLTSQLVRFNFAVVQYLVRGTVPRGIGKQGLM